MRWGSPTATTPFEPLSLAPKGWVLLPALNDVCLFRVSASVFSVFFREIPWLTLLLILGLISVALLLPLLGPIFVALRLLPSVANLLLSCPPACLK